MVSETAGLFIGIGGLVLLSSVAYWMYQVTRIVKVDADKEERIVTLELMAIDKFAEKKGYDIDKHLVKNKLFAKPSFRKKLERQIMVEMFGKNE